MRRKILFVGHNASRTGAPLILLELIKWIKAHSSFEPTVLLKRDGPIIDGYRAVAPTWVYSQESDKLNRVFHQRVLRKAHMAQLRQPDLNMVFPTDEYPVVFANTIDTCDLVLQLSSPERQIVHRIPELSYTTELYGATDDLKKCVEKTSAYIAVSSAVSEYLSKGIGIPKAKINLIHGSPIVRTHQHDQHEDRQTICQRLGIPKESLIVGMSGLPQWRKGTDLFVQLALHARRMLGPNPCHFVWLGEDSRSQHGASYDVAHSGLEGICHFVPAVSNPESYYKAFDVFALTSREEPFSLAMLEAALCGVPIICFDTGGSPDLVEDDAGIVVPYLDVPAMAAACVELLRDEDRRRQFGKNAQRKVQERYLLDIQAPKILALIETALNASVRK